MNSASLRLFTKLGKNLGECEKNTATLKLKSEFQYLQV